MLETNGRLARPYCAAPRRVAVSASEGRAMMLIREPKRSCRVKDDQFGELRPLGGARGEGDDSHPPV